MLYNYLCFLSVSIFKRWKVEFDVFCTCFSESWSWGLSLFFIDSHVFISSIPQTLISHQALETITEHFKAASPSLVLYCGASGPCRAEISCSVKCHLVHGVITVNGNCMSMCIAVVNEKSLAAVDSTCIYFVYAPCWRNCSCRSHSPEYELWSFILSGTVSHQRFYSNLSSVFTIWQQNLFFHNRKHMDMAYFKFFQFLNAFFAFDRIFEISDVGIDFM